MHLIIDGHGCDRDQLYDAELVRRFLDEYPSQIEMTKITSPRVLKYNGGAKPEDGGVSGFVIIAESHISIHTFPERSYVNIDIFSCKQFDGSRAILEVAKYFKMQDVHHIVVNRGLEHLEPATAVEVVDGERQALT